MEDEYEQISQINELLRKIYTLRKEKYAKCKDDDDDKANVEMIDRYNKNNEYFYLKINLVEMRPKSDGIVYHNTLFPKYSPQEIVIGVLTGNIAAQKSKDLFTYNAHLSGIGNVNLCDMITPNINKKIWYLENELIVNSSLTLFSIMTLNDMKKMLKFCPFPYLSLSPGKYKIDDPKDFIKIINEFDIKLKKYFDFIPYLRDVSKGQICEDKVYYLNGNVELISKKCFK